MPSWKAERPDTRASSLLQMTEGRRCQVHLLDDRKLELLVQVGTAPFRHVMVCHGCIFSPGWGEKRVFTWFSQQLHTVLAHRAQGSCTSTGWGGCAKTYLWEWIVCWNSAHILCQNCPSHCQRDIKAALVIFDTVTISLSYFLEALLSFEKRIASA